MSCGVARRCGLVLAWLWLWCRQAAAALIRPLAWELLYAEGTALKEKDKKIIDQTGWMWPKGHRLQTPASYFVGFTAKANKRPSF